MNARITETVMSAEVQNTSGPVFDVSESGQQAQAANEKQNSVNAFHQTQYSKQYPPLQSYYDFHLTDREKQVLSLIASGYTNKFAARELEISPYTIAGYVKEIYRKLHIKSRAEATIVAIKLGLLDTSLLVHQNQEII